MQSNQAAHLLSLPGNPSPPPPPAPAPFTPNPMQGSGKIEVRNFLQFPPILPSFYFFAIFRNFPAIFLTCPSCVPGRAEGTPASGVPHRVSPLAAFTAAAQSG